MVDFGGELVDFGSLETQWATQVFWWKFSGDQRTELFWGDVVESDKHSRVNQFQFLASLYCLRVALFCSAQLYC